MAKKKKLPSINNFQTKFSERKVFSENFVINNNNLYTTQFSSNENKENRNRELLSHGKILTEDFNQKNILYGKPKSFSSWSKSDNKLDYSHKSRQTSFNFEDEIRRKEMHGNNYFSSTKTSGKFESKPARQSGSSYQEPSGAASQQSSVRRKPSLPLAVSGWTPLDEDYNYREEKEEEDSYGTYDDDYDYHDSHQHHPTSYIDQLQFQIQSSPVDIPKLGVQDDFKPIEVLYNELFQYDKNPQSSKQARSIETKYQDSVSWVTSRPPPPLLPQSPPPPSRPSPAQRAESSTRAPFNPFRPSTAPFIPTRPTSTSQFEARLGQEAAFQRRNSVHSRDTGIDIDIFLRKFLENNIFQLNLIFEKQAKKDEIGQ